MASSQPWANGGVPSARSRKVAPASPAPRSITSPASRPMSASGPSAAPLEAELSVALPLPREWEALEREQKLLERERKLAMQERESILAERQTRERAMLEREAAFAQRELALKEREAAFTKREDHFRQREDNTEIERAALRKREAALQASEKALTERHDAMHKEVKGQALAEQQTAKHEMREAIADVIGQHRFLSSVALAERGDTGGGTSSAIDAASVSSGQNVSANIAEPKASAMKKHRHDSDLNNVAEIISSYQETGGQVPLAVLVQEVEALQQATTRLNSMTELLEAQVKEIQQKVQIVNTQMEKSVAEGKGNAGLENRIKVFHATVTELEDEIAITKKQEADLLKRFKELRNEGIERFVPLLLQTVHQFDSKFEQLCRERVKGKDGQLKDGEEALEYIGSLCLDLAHMKGRELRQRPPIKHAPTSATTLIELLRIAVDAGPELDRLARDALRGAQTQQKCEIVKPRKPTKGLQRAVQKVQEEYDGDYTRILDYVRISILCETVSDLAQMLYWFLHPDRNDRFEAVRTKDRISRNAPWDSELSGGNRDVMINGWLQLGNGVEFIVEIQLHMRGLFELKHDLHVLYSGSRVLGAMDDRMVKHEGLVNEQVLERMRRGVLRKLKLTFTKMTRDERTQLQQILHMEPCPLLDLDVSYAVIKADDAEEKPAFYDIHFDTFLEGTAEGGDQGNMPPMVACRRLRSLELSNTGLIGKLPIGLKQCRGLQLLKVGGCAITGEIPKEWFTYLVHLRDLNLADNRLTGEIPKNIKNCVMLEAIYLQGNQLTGSLPEIKPLEHLKVLLAFNNQLSGTLPDLSLPKIWKLLLFNNKFEGDVPISLAHCGLHNSESAKVIVSLNPELNLPDATKEKLTGPGAAFEIDKPGSFVRPAHEGEKLEELRKAAPGLGSAPLIPKLRRQASLL